MNQIMISSYNKKKLPKRKKQQNKNHNSQTLKKNLQRVGRKTQKRRPQSVGQVETKKTTDKAVLKKHRLCQNEIM
jgi:hypothetical protein